MPGGGVIGKGAQTGQAPEKLHAQTIKVQGNYTAVGTNTIIAMPYLWYSYAIKQGVEAQTDIQVQPSNGYAVVTKVCGTGPNIRGGIVQYIWERGM